MGHHCDFTCRFEIEDNDVVRITTAHWKNKQLDVYKEYLNQDKCVSRNIYYSQLGGYLVTFPGEKNNRSYYNYFGYKQELEDWYKDAKIELLASGTYSQPLSHVKEILFMANSDLFYFCKKLDSSESYPVLFELVRMWRLHPECETLIQYGYYKLALNKNLYRLSKKKLKEVLKVLSEVKDRNPVYRHATLNDIQKYNLHFKDKISSFKEWYDWYVLSNNSMKWGRFIEYEDWAYIERKINNSKGLIQINKNEYLDYLEMAKKVGHDIEDPYWRYPNDFRKMHNKVMEQIRMISASKLILQQEFLKEVCKGMVKYNKEVNGYKIFIPVEAIEWQKTCDVLYQCLIRNGYMKKVINQETIIVFIWKDNEPVATAEIDYKKNLQQFYGDERGHRDGLSCLPPDDVQEAFNIWLKDFKPKKIEFKYEDNIHYYKGFHSFENGAFHTTVGCMDGKNSGSSFEIGKIYNTPFDDETILEAGGQGCVSTNKVFHFCSSITEISRHYSPSYYCEIKPLGAIVEHDGALLSNRIEIIRQLSPEEVSTILLQETKSNLKEINIQ